MLDLDTVRGLGVSLLQELGVNVPLALLALKKKQEQKEIFPPTRLLKMGTVRGTQYPLPSIGLNHPYGVWLSQGGHTRCTYCSLVKVPPLFTLDPSKQ